MNRILIGLGIVLLVLGLSSLAANAVAAFAAKNFTGILSCVLGTDDVQNNMFNFACSSDDYLRDLNGGSDRRSRCCVSVGGGCCKSQYSKKYVKYLLHTINKCVCTCVNVVVVL